MAVVPKSIRGACYNALRGNLYAGNSIENATINTLVDTFELVPEFEIVYINFDYDKPIKTQISNGNKDDKIVGYKHLLSYPYDTVRFKIGDYVNFNYNHVNVGDYGGYSTWILESLDNRKKYNVNGRIYPCNQELVWLDDDGITINRYPCHIGDFLGATSLNMGSKGVVQEDGRFSALLQNNEVTKKIKVNKRFIINERAYVVVQKNLNVNSGVVEIYMMKASENPLDDLIDGIAYNGVSIPNLDDGIHESKDISSINVGVSENISFTVIVDKEVIPSNMSVVGSGVPTSYYSIDKVSDNEFIIKNIKEYEKNPLKLNVVSDNGLEKVLYVWLKGEF